MVRHSGFHRDPSKGFDDAPAPAPPNAVVIITNVSKHCIIKVRKVIYKKNAQIMKQLQNIDTDSQQKIHSPKKAYGAPTPRLPAPATASAPPRLMPLCPPSAPFLVGGCGNQGKSSKVPPTPSLRSP